MLKITILVESNDSNAVRQLYEEEKEYHGNDAGAICCLKVNTTLKQLLEPSTYVLNIVGASM